MAKEPTKPRRDYEVKARGPAFKRRRLSPPQISGEENTSPSTLEAESDSNGANDFASRALQWNLEQDYEKAPRKSKGEKKENTRLPVKTAEGRVEHLQAPDVVQEDGDSWLDSEEDGEGEDLEAAVPMVEQVSKVPFRQQILEAKEELANIASLINEDPEEHSGAFRTLSKLAESSNITIKKLALATQLAVYRDVIPGYRIRPVAEDDMKEKLSRDVRQLRNFEQALVGSYQSYVRDLAQLAKGSRKGFAGDAASLASVALSCACSLLLAVPHFNFRGELLKILIDKLSASRVDDDFVKCRETFETLFRDDDDGTPSLDAVSMLTKMMKARNYRIQESVLDILLHLRILSEFSLKGSQNSIDKPNDQSTYRGKKLKEKREFRTKKQRKLQKDRKEVEKEMKEADATVSHEERDRMQAETLKLVFVTYFRILKARTPSLMGAVLEGLAKYAHLINQDFFGDLLEALKDLIGHAELLAAPDEDDFETEEEESSRTRNPTRETLLCIITAFALLQGQESAAKTLHLDLSFFITHLYRTLYPLALNSDLELSAKSLHLPDPDMAASAASPTTANNRINVQTTTILLLRSLSSVLLPSTSIRAVPPLRLAAFTKQLLTCTLHLPEKSALATLGLLGRVTKTHGRKLAGMWNSEERKGDGVFDPLRGEVEGSNPFACTVWEGELLRRHFCPGVREGVVDMERGIAAVAR
ncbi:MAG: hypothetical protein M1827_002661 [Pycnora praestabilis]|nr:MAG: hypothetical protein M1827_002661 [Pycnora praestabilis]